VSWINLDMVRKLENFFLQRPAQPGCVPLGFFAIAKQIRSRHVTYKERAALRLSQLHQILPLAPLLFSVNAEFFITILHQTGLASPSRLNDQANIGGPNGSLSPRSVAHTCHVFP
jgi:hypothetical protein